MAIRTLRTKVSTRAPAKVVVRKRTDPFYLSDRWRRFVDAIIRRRGRRCENCGKTFEDDGSPVRLIADHIIERRDGGADFDENNVQLLCVAAGGDGAVQDGGRVGGCNNRKTVAARSARYR